MTILDDDQMKLRLTLAKSYCLCILRKTVKMDEPGARSVVWEHGRRNMGLNIDGDMPIVCPINDGSEYSGVAIFNHTMAETKAIMDQDPGVLAGIFTYELHECRGFPGSALV